MSARIYTITGVACLTYAYCFAVAVAATAGYAGAPALDPAARCTRACQEARAVLASPALVPGVMLALAAVCFGIALVTIGTRTPRARAFQLVQRGVRR